MTVDEAKLLKLIDIVYEAATDFSVWPHFLKAYAEALKATIAGFQVHYFEQHRSEAVVFFGITSQNRQSYNDYYNRMSVWREHGQRLYVQGRIVQGEELYPNHLLRHSEFYNDYLLPTGVAHTNTAVVSRERDKALTLTATRSENRAPFGEQEQRIAGALLPHVIRAHSIQHKLGISLATEALLNSSTSGFVVFSDTGKCLYINATADSIFRSNDGLQLRSGHMRASEPLTDTRIQHALQRALSSETSLDCPDAVLVDRKSEKQPYHVVISRISMGSHGFVATPKALVIISDPEFRNSDNAALLKQFYGLTKREIELVTKLRTGSSVEESARELGMSYETARTHLRRIFSKTGACRQSELLLLVEKLFQCGNW